MVAFGSWAHVLHFDFNKMEQILNLKSLIDFCVHLHLYIFTCQDSLAAKAPEHHRHQLIQRKSCKSLQTSDAGSGILSVTSLLLSHTQQRNILNFCTDLAGIDARKVSDKSCS